MTVPLRLSKSTIQLDTTGVNTFGKSHPIGVDHIQQSQLAVVDVSGFLSTHELAEKLGMNAQSIRKRYTQQGSYFGVRPHKLPNGRLLWPANSVIRLISGEKQ